MLLFRILPRVVRLVPSNRTIERGAVVAASTRDAEVAGPELLSLCGGAGRGRRGQTSTRAGYAPINSFERPPNRMLRAAPAAAPVREFLRASPEPIHHLALGPTRREAAARVSSIEGLLLCGRPTTTLRTTLDRGVRLRAAQHQRRLRAIFSPWPELGSVSVLARSGSQGRRFAVRGGALTLPDAAVDQRICFSTRYGPPARRDASDLSCAVGPSFCRVVKTHTWIQP